MVCHICIKIYSSSVEEVQTNYNIELEEEDRAYLSINFAALPMFCAAMMTLFEGNQ